MTEIPCMWCISGNSIPAAPSVERTCGDCGGPIWVSETMVATADSGEVRPLCPACMAVRVADAGGAEFRVHPAQTDELAQLGILGEVDWWVTSLNRAVRPRGKGTSRG